MPTEGLALDHVKKESNLQECWPMDRSAPPSQVSVLEFTPQ
jgi:hypothetical protein